MLHLLPVVGGPPRSGTFLELMDALAAVQNEGAGSIHCLKPGQLRYDKERYDKESYDNRATTREETWPTLTVFILVDRDGQHKFCSR